MVKTIFKQKQKIAEFLLFCLFSVFPFGQVIKISFFNLFDGIVLLIAVFTFLTVKKYPVWYKYFLFFLAFALFSWVVNMFYISENHKLLFVVKSLLYLVRLFLYSSIPIFIYSYFKNKKEVIKYLLFVSIVVAVFGWLQYFFWPDTRALKILNWDDHYRRIIGTLLDPGFTAIILVLGSILALFRKKYFIFIFLVLTTLFTYSRAGYLALILAAGYLLVKSNKVKYLVLGILGLFMIGYILLPRGVGEGLKLNRTSTISARILNYNQSLQIIKKSPAIGVGFDNICSAKAVYLNEVNLDSHSCFGLDNSILFILATTGITGLIIFIVLLLNLPTDLLIVTSFVAILVHSLFSNTLFYPHIMAWMGILLGVKVKRN